LSFGFWNLFGDLEIELVESGKDLANGFSQRDSSTLTFAMVGDIIWGFVDLKIWRL